MRKSGGSVYSSRLSDRASLCAGPEDPPEPSSTGDVAPPRRRSPSPPAEAWQRLQELEQRVHTLTLRLDASETADSRRTSRAPSQASPPPPRSPRRQDARPRAAPELAERLARIEAAEQQIYAKWFTARGEPREDCSDNDSDSGSSRRSSGSGAGSSLAGRRGLQPAPRCGRESPGLTGGCETEAAEDDSRGGRGGSGSTFSLGRQQSRTGPPPHEPRAPGDAGRGPTGHSRSSSQCSADGENAGRVEHRSCAEEHGGSAGAPVEEDCNESHPSASINPLSGVHERSAGAGGGARDWEGGHARCGGGGGAPEHVERPGSLTGDDVERILEERRRIQQRREARNASIAAANGIGSAAAVAAAVVTGPMMGLPVGHGGPGGQGPKLGEVDVVAMVEAAADQVIDGIVEEHVDEMLRVCDNAVDWMLASEFAPWPDEK